eukprot:3583390-Lingulodinium_polyedra.AAC.1
MGATGVQHGSVPGCLRVCVVVMAASCFWVARCDGSYQSHAHVFSSSVATGVCGKIDGRMLAWGLRRVCPTLPAWRL